MRQERLPSILKERWNINQKSGFSLVEVILASAVFGLMVTALTGVYLYGLESTTFAGNRARATMLAQEGLEVARNIRDSGYANLLVGTYGLQVSGGQWSFSGTSDVTGIFTRQITISSVDANRKNIVSNVTWQQNPQRSGSVGLTSRLTDWQKASGSSVCTQQSDKLAISAGGASLGSGNRELQNIFVSNTDSTCNIVIDKITVTWTNASRMIQRVRRGNSSIWTGSASSGSLIDVTDITIANIDGSVETMYRYSGTMNGNTFTINFLMSDGTSKIVTGITP